MPGQSFPSNEAKIGEGFARCDLAQHVLDALSAHIAVLDTHGRIVAVNAPWSRYAAANGGDPARTGVGTDYFAALERAAEHGAEGAAEALRGLRRVLNGHASDFSFEYPCHGPDRHQWFAARATRFTVDGQPQLMIAHEDISHRHEAFNRIRHAAHHDELTGLPNRKLFLAHLDESLARARRNPGHRFALLFLDLDRFKIINDSMGHGRGDQLLRAAADRLMQAVVERDHAIRCDATVARLGGDEFTVLLDGVQGRVDAERVALRIHRLLIKPFCIGGQELFVTTSIGITLYQEGDHRREASDLLRDADIAMYRAKAAGKGRYEVFEKPMREHVEARLSLDSDLRRALQAGQMQLAYQPLVSLHHRQITGFEALIRWHHPDHGVIGPADFMPAAEEIGMILPLGRWVLATACRQLTIWQRRFIPDLTMSINISSDQLGQGGLVEAVDRVMQAEGLDPRTLKLEITENAILDPSRAAADDLHRLAARRIDLCLDDFGTGFSSLTHLHRLPIAQMKIDRSFINRIHEDERDEQLVSGVVTLALRLGLDVVAEGVETPRQAQMLRRMGCKFAQGYLFARPQPADQATRILMQQAHAPCRLDGTTPG